jgi:restriction system protein
MLMQAVVTHGDYSDEGRVIQFVMVPWQKIANMLTRDPHVVSQIDPIKWEEIIAASYAESGWFDRVILTPRSGDGGRDIIAEKDGFGSIRFIESVKRFSPGRLVKADDVRALLGVIGGDPKVSKGIISTTSGFAPRIKEDPGIMQYVPTRLEMLDLPALIERMKLWGKVEKEVGMDREEGGESKGK